LRELLSLFVSFDAANSSAAKSIKVAETQYITAPTP
jgi:hypothetical protein